MVRICVAPGCPNRRRAGLPGQSFHQFPKNPNIRKAWIKAARVPEEKVNSTTSTICSKHFREEDIDRSRERARLLRPDVIPSIFSHSPLHESAQSDSPAQSVSPVPKDPLRGTLVAVMDEPDDARAPMEDSYSVPVEDYVSISQEFISVPGRMEGLLPEDVMLPDLEESPPCPLLVDWSSDSEAEEPPSPTLKSLTGTLSPPKRKFDSSVYHDREKKLMRELDDAEAELAATSKTLNALKDTNRRRKRQIETLRNVLHSFHEAITKGRDMEQEKTSMPDEDDEAELIIVS